MAGGQGAAPPVQKKNFNPRWTRMNMDKNVVFQPQVNLILTFLHLCLSVSIWG
jgi:hypothetical protein